MISLIDWKGMVVSHLSLNPVIGSVLFAIVLLSLMFFINKTLPPIWSSTNTTNVVPQAVPNPEEDPEEAKKKARRLKIIFICVLIVTLCIISASIFWYFGYFDPSLAQQIASLLTRVAIADADTAAQGLVRMNPIEILTWLRLMDIIDTAEARDILLLLKIPVPATIVATKVAATTAAAVAAAAVEGAIPSGPLAIALPDPLATTVATGIVATGIAATTAAIISAMATATAAPAVAGAILTEASTLASAVTVIFADTVVTKTLIEASTLAVSTLAETVSIKTASILDAANLEFIASVLEIKNHAPVMRIYNVLEPFMGSMVIDSQQLYLLLVVMENSNCYDAASFVKLLEIIPNQSEQALAELMPQLYELYMESTLTQIMMGWLEMGKN